MKSGGGNNDLGGSGGHAPPRNFLAFFVLWDSFWCNLRQNFWLSCSTFVADILNEETFSSFKVQLCPKSGGGGGGGGGGSCPPCPPLLLHHWAHYWTEVMNLSPPMPEISQQWWGGVYITYLPSHPPTQLPQYKCGPIAPKVVSMATGIKEWVTGRPACACILAGPRMDKNAASLGCLTVCRP